MQYTSKSIVIEYLELMIEKAELILFVIDGSKDLDQEDLELYNKIKDFIYGDGLIATYGYF